MKSVIITGSSKGIGLGMALEFLKNGCAVMISSRKQADVDAAVKDFSAQFGAEKVVGQPCDVTDIGQVQALWDRAAGKFGKVDIWINNAGAVNTTLPVWEVDTDEIKTVINTNIVGHMFGVKVAMKGMLKQGFGQIYNFYGFGSNDEKKPGGLGVYGTTKRAIRYLTELLVEDVKDTPIQVGSLMPGTVITELMVKTINTMPAKERELLQKSFNIVADKVETVSLFLVEEILKNNKNGAAINWMTEEKFKARMLDPYYQSRDLFSELKLDV
jgi:NAD(P)-dependent dehydrogenase (short-subunit alcohol dehydrogenase family)